MNRTLAQYLRAIAAKLLAQADKLDPPQTPNAAGGPSGGTPPR